VFTNVIGSSLDLLIQFVLILIPERRVTHQQDVQDHTCPEHINSLLFKY